MKFPPAIVLGGYYLLLKLPLLQGVILGHKMFENKGVVEFINIARILLDPDKVKSLPSSPVKFSMPMVTYKLTPPISTKFFNFNKFVNNLNLDLFFTNLDSLP